MRRSLLQRATSLSLRSAKFSGFISGVWLNSASGNESQDFSEFRTDLEREIRRSEVRLSCHHLLRKSVFCGLAYETGSGRRRPNRLAARSHPIHLCLTYFWSGARDRRIRPIWIYCFSQFDSKGLRPSVLTASWRRAFVPHWRDSEMPENISAGTVFVTPARPT